MSLREPQLPIQAEKILSHSIRTNLLAYCSRTDLFATVNDDEVVDVYRLGGQRAFSVKRKSPSINVVGLNWIRNGKCLAIALSNGNVDIVSGETGKVVRHGGDDPFVTSSPNSHTGPGIITCLGWGTTLTSNIDTTSGNNNKMSQSTGINNDQKSTEDWYDEIHGDLSTHRNGEDATGHTSKTREAVLGNLPRQLALIDVESVLPRLSPIPVRANTGGRYDIFATQAALDDYFDSMQQKDRSAADVMVTGHKNGVVRLVIDDILEVGLPSRDDEEASGRIKDYLQYSSHPTSPYHALLCARPTDDGAEASEIEYQDLSLSVFDIPLLSSGGSHLHLIVSRTAQVRDLCNYISYSIMCAKSDWTTNTNLPSRFMENINETLEEKREGTLEQNLFHLAMTGHFSPTILEWLRDELAERGHKRWDHAMTTLYVEVSKIFQTNLLPALERCIVVATNLRGLARYYEGSKKFDVLPSAFTQIIDALCMLQLLVHEAIQILGEEQRQFRSFSKWLRHEIDLAAADPESISAKDMAEREAPNLDYPRVLAYLEGALTKSRLKPIVHSQANDGEKGQINQPDLIAAIKEARQGTAERQDLISLQTLSVHLNTVCREAHTQIIRWQNSVKPSIEELDLEAGPISSAFDMRMIAVNQEIFNVTVVAVPQSERNKISIHSIVKDCTSPSPWSEAERHWNFIDFSLETNIQSVKFLNDKDLVVLLSTPNSDPGSPQDRQHQIVRFPHAAYTSGLADLNFTAPDALDQYILHSFTANSGFTPEDIIVGRRNVTVLEAGHRKWMVLGLGGDASAGDASAGDEEVDESDSMVLD